MLFSSIHYATRLTLTRTKGFACISKTLHHIRVPVESKSKSYRSIHHIKNNRTRAMSLARLTEGDVATLIAPLSLDKYKGQSGKVAVVGGCKEYTGAPYFASYSALKIGADLSHVFCSEEAGSVIKGYSPELIVHPYLVEHSDGQCEEERRIVSEISSQFRRWIDAFGCVVFGPGLGRSPFIIDTVKPLMRMVRDKGIPMVLDADALWIVNQDPSLVIGCSTIVLTPNVVEYRRLSESLTGSTNSSPEELYTILAGPTIVKKGPKDEIIGSGQIIVCDEEGSPRRAGGQGDILSGCIATFIAWNMRSKDLDSSQREAIITKCAYAGCFVTRRAAKHAFEKKGRAMGATDMIAELGPIIDLLDTKYNIQ